MSLTTDETAAPATQPSRRRAALGWVVIIAVPLLAVPVIRTWVPQPFSIPSGSMEPTIMINDRVLVDKLAFDFVSVHRGDIIVFAKPPRRLRRSNIHDLIKRVIGLPGQTLRSGPNGEIFVDGKLISQPWITKAALRAPQPTICDRDPADSRGDCVGDTLRLPKGEYYVMGDNHDPIASPDVQAKPSLSKASTSGTDRHRR